MYGTDARRGAGGVAADLQSVLRALHEEAEAPVEVLVHGAPERPAGAFLERWDVAARYRRRLPWLLVALALHGLLLALLLLPGRAPTPVAPPAAIQAEIVTEPRITPPPPKPPALVPPTAQIVLPASLVSIPDPAPVAATIRSAQAVAPVKVAASAPPAPAEPVSPPHFDAAYLHNPPPEYPLQARRLREQGTVLLRVKVSAEGGALLVSIERSSGWPALDDAAAWAVKRWRFEPARRGRDPVAAWVLVPIEFDLRG